MSCRLFFFDVLYIHEVPGEDNKCEVIRMIVLVIPRGAYVFQPCLRGDGYWGGGGGQA